MLKSALLPAALALANAAAAQGRGAPTISESRTVLAESPDFAAWRTGKAVVVELKRPHRVVSTSAITGGVSTTVRYLVNHQSLEPASHDARADVIIKLGRDGYHCASAKELGLDPTHVAMMGTAANMHYVAWKRREFRELRVDAFVTAGVEGNATRAGDPTRWYEGDDGFTPIADRGTINTIVIVNRPLAIGADARAVVTMVEGKSAALAELAVPSRQSHHLATGTGTDQFILASVIDSTHRALQDPGAHMKLGELIGDVVRQATLEALQWQNGLERSHTRGIGRTLSRFGVPEDSLLARLRRELPTASYDLLASNRMGFVMEPRLAAATFAYAAVLDRLQYGTIPEGLAGEVLRDQAANVAVAISAKPERWMEFWNRLPSTPGDRLAPYVKALAMGWEARWAP